MSQHNSSRAYGTPHYFTGQWITRLQGWISKPYIRPEYKARLEKLLKECIREYEHGIKSDSINHSIKN